jgi:DNA-binding NtrC family response regulator/pSer/pThr/pTyr-binding forkhead associated (FHA) protein
MLCLVARYKDESVRVPMKLGEVRIGCSSQNEMVLPFPGVSRVHARAIRNDGVVVVSDVGSKNGLSVDSKRVSEATLSPGVAVRIGHALLTLEEEPTSDHEAALHMKHEKRRSSSGGRPTEPGLRKDEGTAAALRFVREVETSGGSFQGLHRRSLLARAAALLGAEAVLLVDRTGAGAGVIDFGGSLPGEAVIDAACADGDVPRGARVVVREIGGTGALSVAGDRNHRLLAVFPGPPPEQASWQSDLLSYLAFKLMPDRESREPKERQQRRPKTAETQALVAPDLLKIPEGFVVGESPAFTNLLKQIRSTVRSRQDVLVLGETGTGKEFISRMIHASGPTADGPFVAINCAAIPSDLLESQLFGVQGRVATGVDPHAGLLAQAEGGSIFLDEIGELAEPLQAKLLRVLQEREVLPLGASVPRKVNLRVISSSNRDLERAVKEGNFRADLYYRLRGLQFHIPPLRERREDIPALVLEFASRAAAEYGKRVTGVSRRALTMLMAHEWPGNVRELDGEVRRAVLVCREGGLLQAEHFAPVRWAVEKAGEAGRGAAQAGLTPSQPATAPSTSPPAFPTISNCAPEPPRKPPNLQEQVDAVERKAIQDTLAATGGNKSKAAELLGVTRAGLAMKTRRLLGR